MATIGRNKAIADLKVVKLSGFLAWLSWLLIHLLFIVELRNRILIFFQIKTEARYDGLWVLRTNTVYNAETVAHVYKALWTVEDIIRTTKSIMDTRPIYHRCNETIRGHVFCSFLALLLKTELERRMKFADLKCEWAQVIRGLAALQQVEVTFQDKCFVCLPAKLQRRYGPPESPHPPHCARRPKRPIWAKM